MSTLDSPRQPGMPRSAESHESRQDLAVLTRVNHDMRSPLSVILGVFELLENSTNLTDGERRYLDLGTQAADELLDLADGLRLYSAMERNLVSMDVTPVDLAPLAREELEAALRGRDVSIRMAPTPKTPARALADAGYVKLALGNLVRHLSAHLPETDEDVRSTVTLHQQVDEQGRVMLQMAGGEGASSTVSRSAPTRRAGPTAADDLVLLNGIRLIESMGGEAAVEPERPLLTVRLPAADRE